LCSKPPVQRFVVATFTIIEGDGTANLSPVWLFVVTLPWSLLIIRVVSPGRDVSSVVIAVGLVVAVGLNGFLLGRAGDRGSG
jgi:hypothetical protein